MKYSFFAALFAAALLLSCSASNDDGEEIPAKTAFKLEEKIVGKWDVDTQESENMSRQKQSTPQCNIFSLIFNADGTFIITHQDGTITGDYKVEGENLISLGKSGSIGEISFNAYGLFFRATLTDICSGTGSAGRDEEYVPGDCYSFLFCMDNSFWSSADEEQVVFLQFQNRSLGEFFVRNSFFTDLKCKEKTSNEQENGTSVMVANYNHLLQFILDEGSPVIYSYTPLEDGKLQEEIQTTEGTRTRIFEPASESEMDAYSPYVLCGEKTYLPDDSFEKWLIHFGYDDVLDNYVLTGNIDKIETLHLSESYLYGGWEFLDLTGLQDFVTLKDLEVQASNLIEIDLSGNINLERLFLGSPVMSSLDLTHNIKLKSLYFEFAQIQALELSQNTELTVVELQLMPLPFLDISKNNKLEMLTIEGGGFKELIAGEHPALWHLNVSGNKEFAEIDVRHFPNLKELNLSGNKLTAVNVSTLNLLEGLEVRDNFLTSLN
uniref:hypothetical protein n=1 Tax=Salegentibacter sp. TaxID=1903072 RepID=UPI003563341F